MRPARPALVPATVAVLLLAGCSGGSGAGTGSAPPSVGTSSVAPSPSAPTSSAAPTTLDETGHEVVAGRVVASGARQRAVVAAWLAYWRLRQDTFASAKLDASQLGSVATGKAADQIISYASDLASRKRHVAGDLRIGVDRITVRGSRATLRSCIDNRSTERKPDGSKAEALTPFYRVDGELQKGSSGWRVSSVAIAGRTPC